MGHRSTPLAAAEIDPSGAATYRFYFEGTSAPAYVGGEVPAGVAMMFTGGLGLVLEPMAGGIATTVDALLDGAMLVVDVNCRPRVIADRARYLSRLDQVLARADVVKVSDEDLAYLSPDADPFDTATALLDTGASLVLLTAGGEGVRIISPAGVRSVPVEPVAVVDTIGAGDAFVGAFMSWWTNAGHGRSRLGDLDVVERAVRAANQVAGITCTRRGASLPMRHELPGGWGQPWAELPG